MVFRLIAALVVVLAALIVENAAAVAHHSKRHAVRHHLRHQPEVEKASAEADDDGEDAEDDEGEEDDESNDEDDAVEQPQPSLQAKVPGTTNFAAATNTSNLSWIGVYPTTEHGTQDDKAGLDQAVHVSHDMLVENIRKQVEVQLEIKDLDDNKKMDSEVDAQVEAVANETQSQNMADFLGDMWKEMRSFAKPFYKEHLEEKLAKLEGRNTVLRKNFNNSKDELTAWEPKIEVPPSA